MSKKYDPARSLDAKIMAMIVFFRNREDKHEVKRLLGFIGSKSVEAAKRKIEKLKGAYKVFTRLDRTLMNI